MKKFGLFFILLFFTALPVAHGFDSEIPPGEGRLTYFAKKAQFALKTAPQGAASPAGFWTTKVGSEIPVAKILVLTVKPGKITFPQAGTLQGRNLGKIQELSKNHYYDEKIMPREVKIPAGTSMEYLMYRAEGNYLVRYEGDVWEMAPSIDVKIIEPTLATWLQVKGADGKVIGWVKVTNDGVQIKNSIE